MDPVIVSKNTKKKIKKHVKRTFSTKDFFNESKWDFLTCVCKTCSNRNFLNKKKIKIKKLSNNWNGVLCHIWAFILPTRRIFPKNLLRSGFSVYNHLTLCTILEKTNDWILRKSKKGHFWALFAQIWANENFPEKSGSVTFVHLWISNFVQISEKKNKPILRKMRY